ncbi:hypothetical protein BSL78_09356 [Apostichopus japonicus]|uniref:Galactosylceramide sulfotransferase n=1 Tax=Stichopus japonicus TaxID=307972 RepID=A0A2G8L0G7_STIJA|nr:hypothetical protein BSL78_09356 [Apostichopus japonicus]
MRREVNVAIGVLIVSFSLLFALNSEMTSKYTPNFFTNEKDIRQIFNYTSPQSLDRSWLNVPHRGNVSICQPNGNIAFLKTHKTGSTTLRNILNRYGVSNNLSFILSNKSSAGHVFRRLKGMPLKSLLPPIGVAVGDYKRYQFNITNVHMRPDWKELRQLMNPSTSYITILRHPVDQWLSSFQYFHHVNKVKKFLHLEPDPVKAFLKFRNKLGSSATSICNQQIRDIEYSSEYTHLQNTAYVQKKIEEYSKLFSLVLITEYFDESLILLKRLLCWKFEDILYLKMREQPNPLQADSSSREQIQELNKADMMLYTHFNETFWQMVDEYGPDFEKDLRYFRDYLTAMQEECVGESKVAIVAGNHENVRYNVKNNSANCTNYVAYTSSGDALRRQRHSLSQ